MTLSHEALIKRAFSSFETFCSLLLVKNKEGKLVPFILNDIQRLYVARMTNRDVIVKGRQVGMTTLLIALDIFRFLTIPGFNVLVMCQSKQDNGPKKKLIAEIQSHLDRLASVGLSIDFKKQNSGDWELSSGATLRVDVAGASPKSADKGIRGLAIHVLHATEVAFWDLASDTWNGLSKSVPEKELGSYIVLECTPNGASGLFYEEFKAAQEGRTEYTAQFFPWYLQKEYRTPLAPGEVITPNNALEERLAPEQVKWYRRQQMGEKGHLVLQEYPSDPDSCFLGQGRGFFDSEKVVGLLGAAQNYEALHTYTVAPRTCKLISSSLLANDPVFAKLRTVRVFHQPEPDREYVIALDPSEGVGLDASGGIVLERGTGRHMCTVWGQFKPEELAFVAVLVAKEYNYAEIACERLNHGHAVRVALTTGYQAAGLKAPYPNLFRDHDRKFGWINTVQSRTAALDHLEQAVRTNADAGGFTTSDIWLIRELKDFIVKETASGKARAEAERGKHDDLVFSLCIAWSVICRRRVRRDTSALAPA